MFIIRNISEQKSFADVKHATVIADSRDSVAELTYIQHVQW